MKILAVNGSARYDGNTAMLLNVVCDELNKEGVETEMIQLAGKTIEPCRACWRCAGRKNCVNQKDCFCEIFEKAVQADGLLLASPVYSANISSTMQAFLERASVVADMNKGLFRRKVGASVTAARRGGAVSALDAMNHFFLMHDMFLVGSSYLNVGYGRLPGEVENDAEGIETMKNLGQNIVFLMKSLKGGIK